MKRYNLSAEFVRWEGRANLDDQVDSFEYVVDVESEDEAQARLETLIIERMSSKPGWTYKLISSRYAEFETSDSSLAGMEMLPDAIRLSDQSILDNYPETQVKPGDTTQSQSNEVMEELN